MSRIDAMEKQVHGKERNVDSMVWSSFLDDGTGSSKLAEEARFGVLYEPMQLVRGIGMPDAQWTGVVTSIAVAMLESGRVDAVVCIAANEDDGSWSAPQPILARTVQDVLRGRGVKPALAPSLQVLDQIQQDDSIQRLLFCGVGCSVQAFRAVQSSLNLKEVYVLGTNCVDNSPTPDAADQFLRQGVGLPMANDDDRPIGYEFMQDFKVHVKTSNGYVSKPYFSLAGTIAEKAIAKSCLACFDYTNSLADVVVGYMGAPLGFNQRMTHSLQTLSIRNDAGRSMVDTAVQSGRLKLEGVAKSCGPSHEQLAEATVLSDAIVQGMVGGNVPAKEMPTWIGEILAMLLQATGPKGVAFARYSIDYHILRNYLHVLAFWGEERARRTTPLFALTIVDHYLSSSQKLADLKARVKQRDKT